MHVDITLPFQLMQTKSHLEKTVDDTQVLRAFEKEDIKKIVAIKRYITL